MAGIAGLKGKDKKRAMLRAKGEQLSELEMTTLARQMDQFKGKLQQFALKHSKAVAKDPDFRRDFQRMCDVSGVDALASKKGFWSELFGMGDFYFKLGVQIVDVCLATRPRNGGLIPMSELLAELDQRRPGQLHRLQEDDVERAIAKLKDLGNGFKVHSTGPRKVVQSVPTELNPDHTKLLDVVAGTGHVSVAELADVASWDSVRAQACLNEMLKEGMAWVDLQTGSEANRYWFPGLLR